MDGLDIYIGDYSIAGPDCAGYRASTGPRALHLRSAAHARERSRRRRGRPRGRSRADADAATRRKHWLDLRDASPRRHRRRRARPEKRGRNRAQTSHSPPRIRAGAPMSLDGANAAPLLVQWDDASRSGGARARARALRRARGPHRCSARRSSPRSPAPLPATWSSRARRRRSSSATSRRRAGARRRSASSIFAKPADGRPKRARQRRRSPRCSRSPGLPDPEPVPRVTYESQGQLLIVGPAEAALHWADALSAQLAVTVLATGRAAGAELPAERSYPVHSGKVVKVAGWLGAFDVAWVAGESDRSRPVHALQRVHQGVPGAGDRLELPDRPRPLQGAPEVRRSVRRDGRDRFRAQRQRARRALRSGPRSAAPPDLRMHQPPQGYFAPGADPVAQANAATELAAMTGEFEKPKYFAYKASICAHARSQKVGLHAVHRRLLDRGDSRRRRSRRCRAAPVHGLRRVRDGLPVGRDELRVSRRCPISGARLRTLLATYAKAGGRDAALLLHAEDGRAAIARLARRGRGLPARVIPLEVHHVASIGLDVWLAALAHGASQVAVLADGKRSAAVSRGARASRCGSPTRSRRRSGYQGEHFRVFEGADTRRSMRRCGRGRRRCACAPPATFAFTHDKRTTAALAIEHLAQHAPVPQREIALPAGAPYGTIAVDHDTCTMCLACVGACPEGAILDNAGSAAAPLHRNEMRAMRDLREDVPGERDRALAAPQSRRRGEGAARRSTRRRCSSASPAASRSGREKMIANMLGRLAGHSMFAAPGALDRLQDVRRLPRDRPDEERARGRHPRCLKTARVALARRLDARGPGARGLLRVARAAFSRRAGRRVAGGDRRRAAAGADARLRRTATLARLAGAWNALRAASDASDADAARTSIETLFVGVGRSEVSLYASHYLGPQSGRPLAEIRATLAELGLARRPARERVRGPSRACFRDDADAGRRRRRAASRAIVASSSHFSIVTSRRGHRNAALQ